MSGSYDLNYAVPLKSELQLIHEAVGDLALEYEHQYPSAFDRTARVCPWLRMITPEEFFALVPYHKDARTVVAREHGFRDWMELAASCSEPDATLFDELDANQKTALGYGEAFTTFGVAESDSSISLCLLWLSLARKFDLIEQLADAAGSRLWSQVPSLLRRLIESDAPLESVNFCLSGGISADWEACACFAHRLGRADIVEAMRSVGDLPALSDLDMLLEACSNMDEEEVEAWLFRSPHLLHENHLEVWRTVSHWASLGKTDSMKLVMKSGLKHPGSDAYWCSPLHHAAWNSDIEVIEACFDLGCPIHSQDRKYLSTPFGWLIRAHSLTPNGISPFRQGEPLGVGQMLIAHGAVVMPSHLFCPNRKLVDRLLEV